MAHAIYRTQPAHPNASCANLLGFPKADAEHLRVATQEGLPFEAMEHLGHSIELTAAEIATEILLPTRTFQRRKKEGMLHPDESDRLVRLGQIVAKTIELFEGDSEAAKHWLQTPAVGLGGEAPIKYAQTHIGARTVEDLIERLEDGVFA